MAKLRKLVTYTDYRWEETEELTPEQLKKWESKDENLELSHDKVLEDHDWPELVD